jgi:AsmA protein
MKKKLMIGMVLFLILVVGVIVLLPYVVDLARYRDYYVPEIEQALGRPVEVKHVRLSVFPRLGVRLGDMAIADDPAFGSAPFLEVPEAEMSVQWLPLLKGRVQVDHLIVKRPTLRLVRLSSGQVNVSGIRLPVAGDRLPSHPQDLRHAIASPLGLLAVERLSLMEGTVIVEDRFLESVRLNAFEQVSFESRDVQVRKTAVFHGTGTLVSQGMPLSVKGRFGPIQPDLDLPEIMVEAKAGKVDMTMEGHVKDGWLEMTLHIPTVSTDDLPWSLHLNKPVVAKDVVARVRLPAVPGKEREGFSGGAVTIDPLQFDLQSGESRVSVTGKGTSNRLHLNGTSSAFSSRDVPVAIPVRQPFTVDDLQIEADVEGLQVSLPRLAARAFGGTVTAEGKWNAATDVPTFSLKGAFEGFSVESVTRSVPFSTVGMTGRGVLHWNLAGAVQRNGASIVKGPVRLILQRGKLIGVDLVEELEQVLSMHGQLGPKTGFTAYDVIRADGELGETGLTLPAVAIDGQAFSSRGAGMLGFDRSLKVHGELVLPPQMAEKILRRYPMAKVALKGERFIIPYVVQGTLDAPRLGLDARVLGAQVKSLVRETVEKALKGDDEEIQQLLKKGEEALKKFFGR